MFAFRVGGNHIRADDLSSVVPRVTAADVADGVLALGTQSGAVHVLRLQRFSPWSHGSARTGQLLKLIPASVVENAAVTCISFCRHLPQFLVISAANGIVALVHCDWMKHERRRLRVLHKTKGHSAEARVSALKWTHSAVFSGDASGVVMRSAVPGVTFAQLNEALRAGTGLEMRNFVTTRVLKCESSIVQFASADSKQLLAISTLKRVICINTEKTTGATQVGKKLRNGQFGVCIEEKDEEVFQLLCARKGRRLWRAGADGTVAATLKFSPNANASASFAGAQLQRDSNWLRRTEETLELGGFSALHLLRNSDGVHFDEDKDYLPCDLTGSLSSHSSVAASGSGEASPPRDGESHVENLKASCISDGHEDEVDESILQAEGSTMVLTHDGARLAFVDVTGVSVAALIGGFGHIESLAVYRSDVVLLHRLSADSKEARVTRLELVPLVPWCGHILHSPVGARLAWKLVRKHEFLSPFLLSALADCEQRGVLRLTADEIAGLQAALKHTQQQIHTAVPNASSPETSKNKLSQKLSSLRLQMTSSLKDIQKTLTQSTSAPSQPSPPPSTESLKEHVPESNAVATAPVAIASSPTPQAPLVGSIGSPSEDAGVLTGSFVPVQHRRSQSADVRQEAAVLLPKPSSMPRVVPPRLARTRSRTRRAHAKLRVIAIESPQKAKRARSSPIAPHVYTKSNVAELRRIAQLLLRHGNLTGGMTDGTTGDGLTDGDRAVVSEFESEVALSFAENDVLLRWQLQQHAESADAEFVARFAARHLESLDVARVVADHIGDTDCDTDGDTEGDTRESDRVRRFWQVFLRKAVPRNETLLQLFEYTRSERHDMACTALMSLLRQPELAEHTRRLLALLWRRVAPGALEVSRDSTPASAVFTSALRLQESVSVSQVMRLVWRFAPPVPPAISVRVFSEMPVSNTSGHSSRHEVSSVWRRTLYKRALAYLHSVAHASEAHSPHSDYAETSDMSIYTVGDARGIEHLELQRLLFVACFAFALLQSADEKTRTRRTRSRTHSFSSVNAANDTVDHARVLRTVIGQVDERARNALNMAKRQLFSALEVEKLSLLARNFKDWQCVFAADFVQLRPSFDMLWETQNGAAFAEMLGDLIGVMQHYRDRVSVDLPLYKVIRRALELDYANDVVQLLLGYGTCSVGVCSCQYIVFL
ncbi:MAG: hypothetical protein MHM6MM_004720 [Cercozoa sp. M6MM]